MGFCLLGVTVVLKFSDICRICSGSSLISGVYVFLGFICLVRCSVCLFQVNSYLLQYHFFHV